MTNYTPLFTLIALTFIINGASAQNIGISNTGAVPNSSSMLDIDASPSNNKGLLIPRIDLTATNSALPVTTPATSLLVYNKATAGVAPNSVSPGYYYWDGTAWIAFGTKDYDYDTVSEGGDTTANSTSDTLVPGMSLIAGDGTYMVTFNGECDVPDAVITTGFNTTTAKLDLDSIYNDIIAIPATNTTHPVTFGSGETLVPGVYALTGAVSIAGALTLDGGGDPDALFVIRATAAFNTAAGVTVTLINGAADHNVFWLAQDAVGLGASTTIQGTIFSNSAAIAVGTSCILSGPLLTKAGAVSFGPGTISTTANPSFINLRSLSNFLIFTGAGGVANTGASTYNGNIGTDLGAITGFTAVGCTVNGTIYQAGSTTSQVDIYHKGTFSLYGDGVLIPNSSRSFYNRSVIHLQGFANVIAGRSIEVRWKIDSQTSDDGRISIGNRILSITKVQ
ncbi:MAG: ice-binding family protein [Vicingaceae bacterium]